MKNNLEKPSLEYLFESKRLEKPSDDFLCSLNERVKGHALASLSKESYSRKFVKPFAFVIAFTLAFGVMQSYESFFYDAYNYTGSEPETQSSTRIDETHIHNLSIIQNLEIVASTPLTENVTHSDLQLEDKSSFVEQNLKFDYSGAFEISYLSNVEYSQDDLFARSTF